MALNPIAFTESVVRNFLRYQLTTYPFADERLYRQMRRLLSLDETRLTPLLKGPYISLSRSFRPGASIADLIAQAVLHPTLQGIASYPGLYGHQEKAIRAIQSKKTTLVSTGTGSGKTECFLYPIISRCLELKDQRAPDGIVAVLVYPMNALAEDQLGRLRELLAGSGISFGLYVGKTPNNKADVAGERLRSGASREDYRRALQKAQDERRGTAVHPPEERCSREEMRTPGEQPRVLLTNVKQLELLLTRQSDETLFDKARLEYLVFDEAHTFSGAVGAETACLIRRLRAFCGRGVAETTCIATSATIADPEGDGDTGREFAARFFGVEGKLVEVVGEEYQEDDWAPARETPPPLPGVAGSHLAEVLRAIDETDGGPGALSEALRPLGQDALPAAGWEAALHARMSRSELAFQMAKTLRHPRHLTELLEALQTAVGRAVPPEEALLWLALGAAAKRDGRPLLRPVVHAFITGVTGAIVTFTKGATEPRLWLSAEEAERDGEKAVRLPVTTCTTCGQHYLVHHVADFSFTDKLPGGGQAVGDRLFWPSLDAGLGGKRVVLVDVVIAADDDDDDPARTARVFLCRICGALHPGAVIRCDACGEPDLIEVLAIGQKEESPGSLTRCVSCGAPGRAWGGGYREPARPVRAVTVSDVHVLAQEMVHQAERRRLLVFADNRQDAAFQAGWMRDHARRFRLRALMAERLREGPITAGDLVAHLEKLLDGDSELSRSIAPEIWNVATKEAAPQQHAQERHTFLRIQVLRELATGVKQRIGLEPWGRLRVNYAGLDGSAGFVTAKAGELGVTPDVLAEGIAGLLDRFRRNLHLLDREGTHLFSRFWDDGAPEILRGYTPKLPGVPKGLKLQRAGGDDTGRVTQWLSERGDTLPRQVARTWGVPAEHVADFVRELWAFLLDDLRLLAPVTLKGGRGGALPNCSGTVQIDVDRLTLTSHQGRWRCRRCRRSQPRPAPLDRCMAWRCDGTLEFIAEDPDNYDLALLDANVAMLRPREHSAQVPAEDREFLERAFKGDSEIINTLVCTPTLELGVDIGALDTVLMRNVPPLPANYWQRAGRAGRRHRMAVNVTYARNMSHDRTYFTEPLRMLTGAIEPPRFNMRNELMVRKHVHAAVLTRLGQLKRPEHGQSEFDRTEITETIKAVFPGQIKQYLFDDTGQVRPGLYDVSGLRTLVSKHETNLLAHARSAFTQGWPATDSDVVTEERLRGFIREMPTELERVVRTLRKRLDWALDQIQRLQKIQNRQGALEPDQEALRGRCERLIKRYKGQSRRQRRESEGVDDIATFNVLAAEGFLPGYGLEIGAVIATAQVPRQLPGLGDFDLGRAPSAAVREFVPGNLIYANGHRFTPRHYHFSTEMVQPIAFQVDTPSQSVLELGAGVPGGMQGTSAAMLRAVPICDVDLPHMSHISDEEDYRFQVPVAVYGYEQGRHGGGRALRWGDQDVLLRRSVHLRLVNVGAASLTNTGRLGYDVCLVCGQSRSPFSSHKERDKFATDHRDRCGQAVAATGFYTDVVADALSLPGCDSREAAYSVLEALRLGASRVLDMEREDLEILVIGRAGSSEVDAVLYDPMPGGSGLLDQVCARFDLVQKAALEAMDSCASACARSCIDCLQIFRNAFFHNQLSRHKAAECLRSWGENLAVSHDLPAKLPTEAPSGGQAPTNNAESSLREMLARAGFPEPEWQKRIAIGPPYASTTPDCFFKLDDPAEPGVCVYLDGLSQHIHGNPATATRDRDIRAQLESKGYVVLSIAATELSDRDAMRRHFYKLGKELLDKDKARGVRDEPGWFGSGDAPGRPAAATPIAPFRKAVGESASRFKTCVPLVSLKAAAGLFSEAHDVAVDTWVEPATSHRLDKGMFVAQVVGRSMEPRIPDSSYCLFRGPVEGSRSGRILLVQHRDIQDPETGGGYTVKRYTSRKAAHSDGSWAHKEILLEPINRAFSPIVLAASAAGEVVVLAELVDVLPGAAE